MAINMNRDMKFSDLSEDVKLKVTKWLPKDVKIVLVDVFPPVVSQIKSVSLQQLTLNKDPLTADDINQAVDLYKKLKNVTMIPSSKPRPNTRATDSNRALVDAIGSNLRPDIEYFSGFDRGCGNRVKYVELLHQNYPDFDGSRIKINFQNEVADLLKKYPNLKLNRLVRIGLKINEYSIIPSIGDPIRDPQLRKLIKVLDIVTEPESVLPRMQLESLKKLKIRSDSLFFNRNIENIRSLSSRLKYLEIAINRTVDWDAVNAIDFANGILSLEHLESLKLIDHSLNEGVEARSAFYSMVTTLLTTENRILSHLDITHCVKESNIMSILLWNNIRHGFKFFKIASHEGDPSRHKEWFEVNKDTMEIGHFEASLMDVFNKFPHVTQVKVLTSNESYKQGLIKELVVIRSELPRNQWLTLMVGSDRRLKSR